MALKQRNENNVYFTVNLHDNFNSQAQNIVTISVMKLQKSLASDNTPVTYQTIQTRQPNEYELTQRHNKLVLS